MQNQHNIGLIFNVNISQEQKNLIMAFTEERGMSQSVFIRRAIESYLHDHNLCSRTPMCTSKDSIFKTKDQGVKPFTGHFSQKRF